MKALTDLSKVLSNLPSQGDRLSGLPGTVLVLTLNVPCLGKHFSHRQTRAIGHPTGSLLATQSPPWRGGEEPGRAFPGSNLTSGRKGLKARLKAGSSAVLRKGLGSCDTVGVNGM